LKHPVKNSSFIKMGIALARKGAAIKIAAMSVLRKRTNKQESKTQDSLAIIANQQEFNEQLQLVKFSQKPLMVKGRIAIDPDDTISCLGNVHAMDALIKRNVINHLLFSEGDFSFKEIIHYMQQFSPKVSFLIHARGSKSIVGSNKKNEKGFFISG